MEVPGDFDSAVEENKPPRTAWWWNNASLNTPEGKPAAASSLAPVSPTLGCWACAEQAKAGCKEASCGDDWQQRAWGDADRGRCGKHARSQSSDERDLF